MLLEQFLLLSSTLGTFVACFALLKLGVRFIPGADQFALLSDLDSATNIMDPNTILAFIVGLIASVGFLVYLTSGSESRPGVGRGEHGAPADQRHGCRGKAMLGPQGVAELQVD